MNQAFALPDQLAFIKCLLHHAILRNQPLRYIVDDLVKMTSIHMLNLRELHKKFAKDNQVSFSPRTVRIL